MISHPRLERIKPLLVCPACRQGLHFTADRAACRACARDYPVRDGKIYFLSELPPTPDSLDRTKQWLKKNLGSLYYRVGVDIVAPTFPFDLLKQVTRRLDPSQQLVVDVGCGNRRLHEHIIGVDFCAYDAVDVICDLKALPFRDACIDAFISRSVLEHLEEPEKAVENFSRCTRAGGWSMHLVPFLFPVHASPHDYQRYTAAGLRKLFRGFRVVEQTNPTGPFTLMLLCLTEFFSILLSFGNASAKAAFYLLLCVLTFPFKYLDIFFIHRRSFMTMAPSIFTILKKEN